MKNNKHENLPIVHLGDCLDIMKSIAQHSIDMVLCDMPYGATKCSWDTPIDLERLWQCYDRIVKPNGAIILFAQTPFDKVLGVSNLRELRYEWIWNKIAPTGFFNANKMPLKCHENIMVFYKKPPTYNPQVSYGHKIANSAIKELHIANKTTVYGKSSHRTIYKGDDSRYPRTILSFSKETQKTKGKVWHHPTGKPVELLRFLIRTYTNVGDMVLDNCCGTGSTLVASMLENRYSIGIEKDEQYYNGALARINFCRMNSIVNLQNTHAKSIDGTPLSEESVNRQIKNAVQKSTTN